MLSGSLQAQEPEMSGSSWFNQVPRGQQQTNCSYWGRRRVGKKELSLNKMMNIINDNNMMKEMKKKEGSVEYEEEG